MSAGTIQREQNAYRRGIVLGLTLSEIMILLLFVLLLVLAAYMHYTNKQREQLKSQVAQAVQEQQAAEQKLTEISTELRTAPHAIDDYWQRLRTAEMVAVAASERLATLSEANDQLEQKLERNADLERENAALRQDITELEQDNAALERQKAERQDQAELGEVVKNLLASQKGRSTDQAVADLQTKLARTAELEQRNRDLELGNASLIKQLQGAGKGVEMPSCWYDAKGSIEYLFEIRLTSDGFVVAATDLPDRIDERAALPIVDVPLGRTIGPETLSRTTSAVYNWSKTKLCRFFVRVYDETGSTEKALFKQRLLAVEQHFYKRLI